MARRPNKATGTSTDSGIYSQGGGLKCDTIADIRDPKMTSFWFEFHDTFHPDGRVTSSFVIKYEIEGTVLISCAKISCTSTCTTNAPGEGIPFWVIGEIHSDDMNSDKVDGLLRAREQESEKQLTGEFAEWQERYEERGRERAKETGEPYTRPWWVPGGFHESEVADMGWISDPRNLPNWDGDWSSSMGATSDAMDMFKSKFPQSMNDTIEDMKGQGNEGYSTSDWLADLGADLGIENPTTNWLCYCERVIGGDYNVNARSSLDSLLSRD